MNERDHRQFKLVSEFQPAGDQPEAIRQLVQGLDNGLPGQTLLGVTGSGKTFTIASVVAACNRTTLVLAPNKTLAAQLYREFKEFFPDNAVEYFVSYYDYYQPEAYIPSSDTYIEKDSSINDELDKLRLSATKSLLERSDTLVVSSVSCIYGIGSPMDFNRMVLLLESGDVVRREELLRKLVALQYTRNDMDFHRGTFRVRGDQVDVFPAYEERRAVRISIFGDELETFQEFDPVTGERGKSFKRFAIYPASVYVTDKASLERAMISIQAELNEALTDFESRGKLLEAQRLRERTERDLDMMRETGTCMGIENYSRHISQRNEGERPYTLIDYFPDNFLLVIDESHIALPQVRAMYAGDRSRKMNLVDFGFRLKSALDNRPLKFEEFEQMVHQAIFVSATPEQYELTHSDGVIVEQLVRPTGLIDPEIIVRPVSTQVQDLIGEIRDTTAKGMRVLVTTLTKRFSEELTDYVTELGIKCRYMHSDIDVLERVEILRDLRLGKFDVLIGINLLREGLDLPEVALVAILDADKEGYLRSTRSLIQTIGRAARNSEGRVIMYADRITDSMQRAIEETNRRRERQVAHNTEHGIIPTSISKHISIAIETEAEAADAALMVAEEEQAYYSAGEIERDIVELRKAMKAASTALDFERAAILRDRIKKLEAKRKPQ